MTTTTPASFRALDAISIKLLAEKQAQILREKRPPVSAEWLLDLSRIPVGQKRSHAFVRSSRSSAG
ncbi:MAG: hypothetical protein DMF03_13690 [Verrucomicrobia bacterium]|nr:MAG: hypothetical protein DMF03_13690 [Verrucomicrobiota bacterium]